MQQQPQILDIPREKLEYLAILKSRGVDITPIVEKLSAKSGGSSSRRSRAGAVDGDETESNSSNKTAVIWKPQEGPQEEAFESIADILGYGGAAGGGKTDLILGSAIRKQRKTTIFRREASQLSDIIDRSTEILGEAPGWKYNEGPYRRWSYVDGSDGNNTSNRRSKITKIIRFGGIEKLKDIRKWRGRPSDCMAFDEATEFAEIQIRNLSAWCRSTVPGQKTQIILTFNPPANPEGAWIIKFFAPWLDPTHPNPAVPGELRWFSMIEGKEVERPNGETFTHTDKHGNTELIEPQSRTFFPARITDNKYWEGTNYKSRLMAMPEPFRSQLLYGDFHVAIEDDPYQVIRAKWVIAAQLRWKARMARIAAGDETARLPRLDTLGVDVARGGDDKTVIAARHGIHFAEVLKYEGRTTRDGPDVASLVLAELNRLNAKKAIVNIDSIGVGSSPYDFLKEGGATNVNPVNNSSRSIARDQTETFGFLNTRAESYWKLREELADESSTIELPDDPEIVSDLCAPRFKMTTSGVQLESKADIKVRIGRSPDVGDAIVLAHYQSSFAAIMAAYSKAASDKKEKEEKEEKEKEESANGRFF
jgi:hypothetical protein